MNLVAENPSETPTTQDSGVAALLQRAANVQKLPVGEHNPHYVQLLNELTLELDAEPAAAVTETSARRDQP